MLTNQDEIRERIIQIRKERGVITEPTSKRLWDFQNALL